MIEIKLEQASTLTMEMKIEGDIKGATPQLRLSVLAEGLRYSFGATQTSPHVYQIDFPVMEGKINEGQYDAQVEIMVDGKYFVPLEEKINFTREIKPSVKLAEAVAENVQEVKVKFGVVKKLEEKVVISDARSLIGTLTEGEEIDTAFAIKALNGLSLNETVDIDGFRIAPKRPLVEAEALAALRLIRQLGSDLEDKSVIWEGLQNLSTKTANELRAVLAEKGLSAKFLKQHGF